MVILEFALKGRNYTWFITDNVIVVTAFLLSITTGIILRRRKNSKNTVKKLANPRSGAFLENMNVDECVDPKEVYLLVDTAAIITIKNMLGLSTKDGPVIISPHVFFLGHLVSRQILRQVLLFGVSVYATQVKSLIIRLGVNLLSGVICCYLPVSLASISTVVLAIFLTVSPLKLECDKFVFQLPVEKVQVEDSLQTIGFLDQPAEKNPKIYIKASEDIELYVPTSTDHETCSSEFIRVPGEKKPSWNPFKAEPKKIKSIRRKCDWI